MDDRRYRLHARPWTTWDANEATAWVAYRCTEVISIYPITPSSPMGEHADAWASKGVPNLWGQVPQVVEMQSEAGAAGVVHGALQAGAQTTTFTASQGLLLMIPNMYKIAGELTPAVLHVAARTLAAHALSIFGDHSDVYATRQTGFAMLASGSVQEAHDLALVAHAATLRTRIPFLHFFDGFRTSHEVAKTERLSEDDLRALLDVDALRAHRARALTPEAPVVRGTAQNPDVFFQAREAINPFYDACPDVVQEVMDELAARVGRQYRLFEYVGHAEPDRVIVLMGSGTEAAHETVDWMVARGERVGLIKVHLYRPFSARHLLEALPPSARKVAVLDRTKEPGAPGDPLYLDISTALLEAHQETGRPLPLVLAGRYGLSSKEFTPAMIVGLFGALEADRPPNHFTVGIYDDVTRRSLPWDREVDIEPDDVMRALFFGLGADGTVGANRNTITIIGDQTEQFAQGYFVYDSKKSGAVTVSHLRFGPRPIRSTYLIERARFIGCHQWQFLEQIDVLGPAARGAVLLLNAPHPADRVWDELPLEVQQTILDKEIDLWVIDAYAVAAASGMQRRINTIMQTCFFAISGLFPRAEAIAHIKRAIETTYGKKGDEIVRRNFEVVDNAVAHLHRVQPPGEITATRRMTPPVPAHAPDFVRRVTGEIIARRGDELPVSAFPVDGTWPVGTARWEKRTIATEIPLWDPTICVQCNKCTLVCPHAAIRAKVFDAAEMDDAPEGYPTASWRSGGLKGMSYAIQVSPQDCTGCTLCAVVCPAKDKSNPRHKAIDMAPIRDHLERETRNWEFFEALPETDRSKVTATTIAGSQLLQPLFEFSGACSGCGETPYVKLLTQLFGDRLLIANATGCSSIYGGNLPTTPYTTNGAGRGPAWANSLFEDNAEFGIGMRLAVDQLAARSRSLLERLSGQVGPELARAVLDDPQADEPSIEAQRRRVLDLRARLRGLEGHDAAELDDVADYLVRKSVWIVGGDGWAYDIGFGGLDHAFASGRNVNILVLDTEVYSNTGGQASKSTPLGAVAKYATSGKQSHKKDLAMVAMAYGGVYVAQVSLGAKDTQALRAFHEAESWPGPSLIIAYSPCIAHGYDLSQSLDQQKRAVSSGYWPLFRYDPRLREDGKAPLKLDSDAPSTALAEFAYNETRYRALLKSDPERARALMTLAEEWVLRRWERYRAASETVPPTPGK